MQISEIYINGEPYPCRFTMGAMVRFAEITGHDVHKLDGSVRDMCAYVYACVASGCDREGKRFHLTFMQFCDAMEPTELAKHWNRMKEAEESVTESEEPKKN